MNPIANRNPAGKISFSESFNSNLSSLLEDDILRKKVGFEMKGRAYFEKIARYNCNFLSPNVSSIAFLLRKVFKQSFAAEHETCGIRLSRTGFCLRKGVSRMKRSWLVLFNAE
ncbi:MAG TPA: hypothetical protein VN958_09190 [Chitinophagaceae bacterium]|nr:hypothetical protein [Chitinophagaceae bacterium]